MIVAAAGDAGAAAGFGVLAVVWLLLIALALGGYVLGIWAIVDMVGKPDWAWERSGDSKTTYIVLVAIGFVLCQLISIVGAIVYFSSVRKRLQAAIEQGPPAYPYPAYGYGHPQPYGYAPPGYGPGTQPPPPGYAPPSAPAAPPAAPPDATRPPQPPESGAV